jgi:hypothetical protein
MGRKASFYAAAVCVLSVLVISYQISIINALEFLSYSRFANLIISLALLGFGASGTFLSFFQIDTKKHSFAVFSILFLLLIITLPFSYLLAGTIPLDIQYIFFSIRQFLMFLAYALSFFAPFFLCAVLIGASLALYRDSVYLLYGANLFGSGIGGILVLPLFFLIPQHLLPFRLTLLALCAYILWAAGEWENVCRHRLLTWAAAAAGIAVSLFSFFTVPEIRPDQYKTISYLERLTRQGSAEVMWSAHGPRGVLHLYASDTFHDALFAGPASPESPPKQFMLLQNGEHAGTIFDARSEDEAAILDYTPQSLPYRLRTFPDVLILGETGGTNVLLARRFAAASITVVRQDPNIHRLWTEVLPARGVFVFSGRDLKLVNAAPRLFVKSAEEQYDIIHIASAEGMPALQSGLTAAEENYLLTVEGIRDCLRLLSDEGCIAVTMGLQSPPRDNIKLVALFKEALELEGFDGPAEHVVQGKNYLAAATLLFKKPVDDAMKGDYLREIAVLRMDSEWHPGIESDKILQRNVIPGPPGRSYSYLHHGAKEIFLGDEEAFHEKYMYNVGPPTDDRPYFHHFFRWKSLKVIRNTHGPNWFRSSELGYLLLFCTFIGITVLSFLVILIPHLAGRRLYLQPAGPDVSRKAFWYLYMYPVIGLGFMFVELVLVHRLGIFLGSPVYSIAAVITSMLVFSGAGSVLQELVPLPPRRKIRAACAGLVLFLGAAVFLFRPLVGVLAFRGTVFRFAAALLFIAPPAFFLGWFFSGSSKALLSSYPKSLPLAWGLNGFASVAAAPLATLLAMRFGYTAVLLIAMGLYISVGAGTFLWETTMKTTKIRKIS